MFSKYSEMTHHHVHLKEKAIKLAKILFFFFALMTDFLFYTLLIITLINVFPFGFIPKLKTPWLKTATKCLLI